MSSEENKAIARLHFEEVNKGNVSDFRAFSAEDVVFHGMALPAQGRKGWEQAAAMFQAAFPDGQTTVEDMIAQGDKVVTRWTYRGTHTGEFMGIPPTGKRVELPGMVIDRIASGKIVERWVSFDQLGMMQQLGVMPAPGQGG